jgi:hypothetical protein
MSLKNRVSAGAPTAARVELKGDRSIALMVLTWYQYFKECFPTVLTSNLLKLKIGSQRYKAG